MNYSWSSTWGLAALIACSACAASACHPFEDISDYPFDEDALLSDVLDADARPHDVADVDVAPPDDVTCVCAERPRSIFRCKATGCVYLCLAGAENCDGDMLNGCEPLDSPQNCGGCGHTCGDREKCFGGTCVLSCGGEPCPAGTCSDAGVCEQPCNGDRDCLAGWTCCGGDCADTSSDPDACGNCDTRCLPALNAIPICTQKQCGIACEDGFANCDDDITTGCEANLSEVTTCGDCAISCGDTGSATVDAVECDGGCVTTCASDYADCAGDGTCASHLPSDDANCGACGNPCTGGEVCADGSCTQLPCGGLCTGTQTCCGGTCVDVEVDELHCGSCDTPCPADSSCCGGGACADLLTDAENCGICGRSCGSGQCINGSCINTECTETTCGTGQSCCGGACVSITDVYNCGACGQLCDGTCTTLGCDHVTCTVSGDCSSGKRCCAGTCTNVDVSIDHCGRCDNLCDTSTMACFGGNCLQLQ